MPEQVDLTPDPRILAMLGEINLSQWKCLAELIDNSVDSFLHAPTEAPDDGYHVYVSLPSVNSAQAQIRVRDNGWGMAPLTLEKAVKAGWSGNDPIGNLGLFGMGFNIATARLGTVTSVWTTRREDGEWTGLRIDFADLAKRVSYRTPLLTRPKDDPTESGTEVIIEKIKPEHADWFSRAYNRSNLRKELSRVYSSMLRAGGEPIEFCLFVDSNKVTGTRHCVWDGEDGEGRMVQAGAQTLRAVQSIDQVLPPRLYCVECWQWLGPEDDRCPACGKRESLVKRERRIHGWVGVQRYLSSNNYGIDFIRNGRKIELLNRDLFFWDNDGVPEEEYPIDDPRHRGRIVGEIHLDHCRLPYTKDRFDRTDPVWEEMVRVVRGEGPLQPMKAQQLGYGVNFSPLSRLFQAFRRSTPKPKVAGAWARLLIVEDNQLAEEMASGFYAGGSFYRSDGKWFDLVEEQDRQLLRGTASEANEDHEDELLPTRESGGDEIPDDGVVAAQQPDKQVREAIASLSREYSIGKLDFKWNVNSWRAAPEDAALDDATPWSLKRDGPTGDWSFVVRTDSEVFRSHTFTPLDALLGEIANTALGFAPRDTDETYAAILSALREQYARATRLDPMELTAQASLVLGDIGRRFSGRFGGDDNRAFFSDLSPSEREQILSNAASRSPESSVVPSAVVENGRFLEFAAGKTLVRFFVDHPELFFDGGQWARNFATLDYGSASATEEARKALVSYYEGLLRDVIWLAERDTTDLAEAPRARLLRGALALELLTSEMVPES